MSEKDKNVSARSVVMGDGGSTDTDPNAGKGPAIPRARLALAAIAALLCIALIGVSVWSLATGDAFNPGQGSAVVEQGSSSSSAAAAEEPEGKAGAPSKGDAGDSSQKDAAGAQDSEDEGKGDKASEPSSSPSEDGGASGPATGGQSSGAAGGQSSGGASGTGQNQPKTVTVSISADGSLGGGGVSGPVTLTLDEGATVYDALASAGWSVSASWGAFGAYVSAINGVAAGTSTGWTYSVNGLMPNSSCSSHTLSDGDSIVWTFVEVQ